MADSSFQTGRLLQLTTPLEEDELLPVDFVGTESLSQSFQGNLLMVSSEDDIDPKSVLGKPFSLTIDVGDSQAPRYFNGWVSSFEGGEVVDQIRYYRCELRPWYWFLKYTADCRVFQDKNVPDIVEQIFKENGFSDYDFSNINRGQYSVRDYCTQYRESDLNFVQRLLEEEGIFYYFRHEENKHTLILGDTNNAFKVLESSPVQFDQGSNKDYCISGWKREHYFYSGKITYQDYNFQTPDTSLLAQQTSNPQLSAAQKYEIYHYPGGHSSTSAGTSRAQHHFEAEESDYCLYRGDGSYPLFTSGGRFNFPSPPVTSDEGDYVLTEVVHTASDGSYLHGEEGEQVYHNSFICIPATVTYCPAKSALKPMISSIQTALVVGASGQEIDTDEYGRVKVQFYWDRQGKKNEESSCWIRVAQLWAGSQWGMHFMPRVGQEVVIQFIEGDPDRPLIVGSVYNENNKTPYDLPGSQTQSGIKTQSVGGSKDSYNELRFEDKQGAEEVYIQAQKDFIQNIKNNLNMTVGNDHTLSSTNNSNIKAGKDLVHTAGGAATLTAGSDLTQSAGSNATMSVGNDYTQTTANNSTMSVGNSLIHEVGNSLSMNAGTTATISALESIVFQVGATSMILTASGVVIKTTDFEVL